MTTEEFLTYLRTQVKKYQSQYSLNEGKAFGLWYAIDSLRLEEDEGLRKEVLSKIVDGVLKVPTIKVAHDLN